MHLIPPTSAGRCFSGLNLIPLLLALATSVPAGSGTWTNLNGGLWNTPANWSPNVVPGIAADDVVSLTANIISDCIITNDTAVTLGTLNIGDTDNTHAYALTNGSGGSLTFRVNSGNARINQASGSKGDAIQAELQLDNSLDIANASTNVLNISSNIMVGVNTINLSSYPDTVAGVSNAFNAAADGMNVLIVNADRNVALTGSWSGLVIQGDGTHKISGPVVFTGQQVSRSTTPACVNSDGAWLTNNPSNLLLAPVPAAGSQLVLETAVQNESYNQAGLAFVKVTGTNLLGETLIDVDDSAAGNQGITVPFWNPKLYHFTGLQYGGTLNQGATNIPWSALNTNYWQVGDIVRLENYAGTDTADGSTSYFENAKITRLDETGMYFDTGLNSAYAKPYIVKTAFAKDLTITNAAIDRLTIRNYENVTVAGLSTTALLFYNCYNLEVRDVTANNTNGTDPTIVGITFCKQGVVSNIVASGATGTTDNGNIKIMSPINLQIEDLTSGYSYHVGTNSQASLGVFIDYYYTPYKTWGQCVLNGVVAEVPASGPPLSVWAVGLRNSQLQNITALGTLKLTTCSNLVLNGASSAAGGLDCYYLTNSFLAFTSALYVGAAGCSGATFTGTTTGGATLPRYGRNVWVRPGCNNITLSNIISSSLAADTFIYLQNVSGITVIGCQDQNRTNSAWSLYNGGGVTGLVTNNNVFYEQVSSF